MPERHRAPSLAETQARFHRLVTAPETVAKTLASAGLAARDIDAWVQGDANLTATDRLDIYANMYFFRLLDVLRTDYPRLLANVGDDTFHDLVTDYLALHPPTRPSVRVRSSSVRSASQGRWVARACPASSSAWSRPTACSISRSSPGAPGAIPPLRATHPTTTHSRSDAGSCGAGPTSCSCTIARSTLTSAGSYRTCRPAFASIDSARTSRRHARTPRLSPPRPAS